MNVNPKQLRESLRVPATYVFAGMSNSGKTMGCKKILTMLPRTRKDETGQPRSVAKPFDKIIVFSQTARITGDWQDVTDTILPEPDYELLASIMAKQEAWKAEGKDYQIALIFDDCSGLMGAKETNHPINNFVTMSRHFNISLFFLIQSMTNVNPAIRKNAHFVIVTKIHGSDYKMMFDIQTHFDSQQDCVNLLRAHMKDYNLIIFSIIDCYDSTPKVLSGKYQLAKRITDQSIEVKDPHTTGTPP